MMEMVLRNIRQATGLLTELLDFSRLESGQEQRAVASFDVSSLLRELTQSLQPAARDQALLLHSSGPPTLMVESDRLCVYRMAQNLTLNAIKYTHEGRVQIEWGMEGQHWWFSVSDTGPGLDAELVAGLNGTDPLIVPPSPRTASSESAAPATAGQYQTSEPGDASTNWTKLRGEGIGLRIVRQLARFLEARLTVTSQIGVGTRFVIRFPVRLD